MKAAATVLLLALYALMANALPVSKIQNVKLPFTNGIFRITQFADIHYKNSASPCTDILPEQRPCTDTNTTVFIGRMLDNEKPNLAVFTGDNIVGPTIAEMAIPAYSLPAVERAIPWAMVFGNHDEEANLNREEMMEVTLSLPYTVTQRGPDDVFGVGNYVGELIDSTGYDYKTTNQRLIYSSPISKTTFALYFLDSGDYSKTPGIGGYEWIRPSQIDWYLGQAAALRDANGGVPVPALMFYHIPIPEYRLVANKIGDEQEGVYDANVNSGLFSAFLEAKDVKATFVGHHHTAIYISFQSLLMHFLSFSC